MNAAEFYRAAFFEGLRPDELITVSEWADRHRMLSQKASAEPGRWRTDRTPYLRAIMDALSPLDDAEEIVFMKGAQIGATECGNNWIGFVIDRAPGPMMAVQPTVDMAKRNSKQKIEPLVTDCPVLAAKVSEPRARDSDNTILSKSFPGGTLVMAGANSAAGLRSFSARYLFLDEIDAYPANLDGEGDPIALAEARARTFRRKKIFKVSTPTLDGRSKIQTAWEASTRQRYFVPCPFCGKKQIIDWLRIRYEVGAGGDVDPKTVGLECEDCGKLIPEHKKTDMLAAGEWIAEEPGEGRPLGFHLSGLYSPLGWFSWVEACKEYEKAKKDTDKMRTFVNTVLGDVYREKGDAPEWERLWERRERYRVGIVPRGGLVLTAGVDVQKDRLECEIVAWGRDRQSWSVDYLVLWGDTTTSVPWDALAKLLDQEFETESGGRLKIRAMAVDTGYNTSDVYRWVRKRPIGRVFAVKGRDSLPNAVGKPSDVEINKRGKRVRAGIKLWPVGVSVLKSELYSWLRLPVPTDGEYPSGFCHFPEYGPEFFQMLTAEELVYRMVRGFRRYEWQKIRDRNEALDCRVYARAVAVIVGVDRWTPTQWDELAQEIETAPPEPLQAKPDPAPARVEVAPPPPPIPVAPPPPRQIVRVKKNSSIW